MYCHYHGPYLKYTLFCILLLFWIFICFNFHSYTRWDVLTGVWYWSLVTTIPQCNVWLEFPEWACDFYIYTFWVALCRYYSSIMNVSERSMAAIYKNLVYIHGWASIQPHVATMAISIEVSIAYYQISTVWAPQLHQMNRITMVM